MLEETPLRETQTEDSSSVRSAVSPLFGKAVLVTGGTGAFGNAFVRYALNHGARKVVVLSRGEAKQAEMQSAIGDTRLRMVVGDVRDATRVMDACRGIDIVIHAAALKRVEVCERDPNEAILTNIQGSINVARACIERGVRKAIILSTDKAAAPNTLYGSTKLVAERLWVQTNAVYAAGTKTRFAATRYGNVWASTGSVVSLWKSQADSGRITVTDPTMTRFWMKLDEAVDLVVLALREMNGGEVFIPKLRAARMDAVAEAVAPGCRHSISGIRAGEKLHEQLITDDELPTAYDCGTHYVLSSEELSGRKKVAATFTYSSDTAPRIPVSELREMAA